jgi:hypothetical protein
LRTKEKATPVLFFFLQPFFNRYLDYLNSSPTVPGSLSIALRSTLPLAAADAINSKGLALLFTTKQPPTYTASLEVPQPQISIDLTRSPILTLENPLSRRHCEAVLALVCLSYPRN